MDPLQLRENEVFGALKKLAHFKFVLIGGYAVNAYTIPRFSVDCDIVTKDKGESAGIEKVLHELGYARTGTSKTSEPARFARCEKTLANSFKVSFDILIGAVIDRQTGASFPAGWIFRNSKVRLFKGKTIAEQLRVRVVRLDALFVMKMVRCRPTDIRDIFMMAPSITNKKWVKNEVSSRCNLCDRLRRVKDTVSSLEFRNGIQGVYGLIDNQMFDRSANAIDSLGD